MDATHRPRLANSRAHSQWNLSWLCHRGAILTRNFLEYARRRICGSNEQAKSFDLYKHCWWNFWCCTGITSRRPHGPDLACLLFACTLGISNAIDNPVRQSFNSEIVGHEDIANAVSLNSANFNAGRLIGPAISGGLIAAFGTGPSFLINAATYIFVVMALLKMREKDFFIKERKVSAGKIREAWSYIQARPDLQAIMCIVFFQATFGLNFQIFNALSATKLFHRGPASFGLLGTMIAVGSLSGAILSARMERFKSPIFVIKGSICFGLAITILSLMPNYTAYALWLPVCGFTALMTMIRANALMQIHSDPAIRGRVMGIYLFIFMGGTPFGSPIIGWLAEVIGVRPTIAIGGIVTALAALITWFIYRNRMEVPTDFSIDVVLPPTYNN